MYYVCVYSASFFKDNEIPYGLTNVDHKSGGMKTKHQFLKYFFAAKHLQEKEWKYCNNVLAKKTAKPPVNFSFNPDTYHASVQVNHLNSTMVRRWR